MHFCHILHEIHDTPLEESCAGRQNPRLDAVTGVRERAVAYTTRAKFLSRAALLGIAPTGLVTYSREAIKSPGGYG